MDRIDHQIILFMVLNPEGLPARELQSLVRPSISQPTLWRRLDHLCADNLVHRTGRGRATRYQLSGSSHVLTDLRSKALHTAVGQKLVRRPDLLIQARERLQRMYQTVPYSKNYLDRWDALLSGPLEDVLEVLGADTDEATALRHVSPFTGLLSDTERRKTLRKQGLSH